MKIKLIKIKMGSFLHFLIENTTEKFDDKLIFLLKELRIV